MLKRTVTYPIILWFLFILIGCVHSKVQVYEGETLNPEELSTLITDSKDITIEWVNNKKIKTLQQLWNNKWNAEVLLKPDEYEIEAKYWNGPTFNQHFKSRYLFKLTTLPGHTYQIKNKVVEKSAKLWIVDLNTSEIVGKVLASENEPITELDTILDHSIYFTYRPPQNDNWFIAYRNNWKTALAKKGNDIDETYVLSIILFEVPKLESKEDFLNFVKTERKKDIDSKRFNIIKEDINYYQEIADYCVSYHSVFEDKNAKRQSNSYELMILELAGYTCRHPQNKNIGVNFDYSHRYYEGQEDENLVPRVKELFDNLKF